MTRLNSKFTRIYANGYDLSGETRGIGEVGFSTDAPGVSAYSDDVINTVLGKPAIKCGPLNAFLSPSSGSGLYEISESGIGTFNVMVAFGSSAVPAVGNPVFAWTMEQGEFSVSGDGVVGANISFPDASYSSPAGYDLPFGLLAHAKGAETAANTAVATIDEGASTTKGGIFVYQLFSSDGTVTLSLDEADTNTNPNFAALTGATSGSITAAVAPKSGMVVLSTTATVKRFIRWQMAKGTASTATFALAFIRGR